ncbi:MAG: pimeloyl-ACP methyl ester carboxylesterase [Halioglobus sp.]|jgi:pimeloyl-ACP methyl ester carboxylesterase
MYQLKAPTIAAVAGESLSALEFTRLAAALPSLARQPKGAGDPVMVLPGFGASDASTAPLRRYLTWLGYEVRGWGLGRNAGQVATMLPSVVDQVRMMSEQFKSEVHLIGWSLGGVFARETARDYPGYVSQVVTMGSPVVGGPKYTTMGRIFEKRGADLDEIEATIAARESTPIQVPLTCIYSKRDGIVGWQASIDRHSPQVEHIEVYTTHLGLGISPDVFKIIAKKLADYTPKAIH